MNTGVVISVQGAKVQLFCGAAEFTGQRLSTMREILQIAL